MKQTKRILSMVLCLLMLVAVVPVIETSAAAFSPRLTAPERSGYYGTQNSYNPFWTNSSAGNGNCTWYAWGRAYELLGSRPQLSTGNANTWYPRNVSSGAYPYGSTPKLGAIACWATGSAGHVAVVEAINGDGTITISESSWNATSWWFRTNTINSNCSYYSAFQGFIYIGSFSATARIDINPNGGTAQDSFYVNFGEKCNLTIDSVWRPGYALDGWNLYRPADEKWFCAGEGWYTSSEMSANGYKKQEYSANLSMTLDDSWYGNCSTSVSVFTFYPVWKEATYKININANGGIATTSSLSLKINTKCNLSSNFVYNNGYKLAGWNLYRPADGKWFSAGEGWYTESEINAKGYQKQLYIPNLSMTLDNSWFGKCNESVSMFTFYAVWEPATYTININANGGTVVKSSISVVYDTKCNLSSAFVQRTGYKLEGWNLYRPADGKWFAAGEGWYTESEINVKGYKKQLYIPNLSMNLGNSWFQSCNKAVSSFTFYAVWAPCSHTWNSGTITKAATCITTGTKTYTCTVCNATKTETIAVNPNNHVNKTNTAATASTCTVKGYTAGVYCNDCKKYISGHMEQPLAAHTLTTQNAKAATCTAEGYTGDQVCTVCKQTITKGTAIAKKSHSLTMVNKAEASCTTAGYTGDQVCTVCKQTITKGSAIAALGHANADSNGNCTRCGQHIKDVTPSQPSNPQPNPNACKYCGKVHTGPFGWLIKFFHSILAIFKR